MALHIIDIGRIGPVISVGIGVGFEFNEGRESCDRAARD
jgi:hypothetical protein